MRDERTPKDVCGEAKGGEDPRHFYVGVFTGRYLRPHCYRMPYSSVYSNVILKTKFYFNGILMNLALVNLKGLVSTINTKKIEIVRF